MCGKTINKKVFQKFGLNPLLHFFIRFDFKIVSRGETNAGYYYEGNDFSQVVFYWIAAVFI